MQNNRAPERGKTRLKTEKANGGISGCLKLTQAQQPTATQTCQSACGYSVLNNVHLPRNKYEISKLDLWIPAEALI